MYFVFKQIQFICFHLQCLKISRSLCISRTLFQFIKPNSEFDVILLHKVG